MKLGLLMGYSGRKINIPLDVIQLAERHRRAWWLHENNAVRWFNTRELYVKALARFVPVSDAFALADAPVAAKVRAAIARAGSALPLSPEIDLAGALGGLGEWLRRFRRLQMREIWAAQGAWIEANKPRFGPEIADRFAMTKAAAATPPGDDAEFRDRVAAHLDAVLGLDGVLLIPTGATIAPPLNMSAEQLAHFRDRTLSLTCIAGLARLPQVQIPAGRVEGAAVGLSLIGPRGSDRALLALAEKVAATLD